MVAPDLYVHNLQQLTGVIILLVQVYCKSLTSLCFPLFYPVFNIIPLYISLHTFRTISDNVKCFSSNVKHNLEIQEEKQNVLYLPIVFLLFFLPS